MSYPDIDLPADDHELERVLRASRRGPGKLPEESPWEFVRNWPAMAVRLRVWPMVSRFLVDADEFVRARAVEFVREWDALADLTMPRLLEVAATRPDLYGDQSPEGTTLRDAMAFALGNRSRPENDTQVASLLRDMCEHEVLATGSLLVGRHHPDFVIDRATVWGEAQARWFADAASSIAMYRRDALLPVLEAFRTFGDAAKERILAEVERYIARDDANATHFARGAHLPPPTRPAPSAEECRQAIGLR